MNQSWFRGPDRGRSLFFVWSWMLINLRKLRTYSGVVVPSAIGKGFFLIEGAFLFFMPAVACEYGDGDGTQWSLQGTGSRLWGS
jgi:hypothetical protein